MCHKQRIFHLTHTTPHKVGKLLVPAVRGTVKAYKPRQPDSRISLIQKLESHNTVSASQKCGVCPRKYM